MRETRARGWLGLGFRKMRRRPWNMNDLRPSTLFTRPGLVVRTLYRERGERESGDVRMIGKECHALGIQKKLVAGECSLELLESADVGQVRSTQRCTLLGLVHPFDLVSAASRCAILHHDLLAAT